MVFEFIVPMFPHGWLTGETVDEFREIIQNGGAPTAISVSVLDRKQPANWYNDQVITEHWCLAHYLIDGHHKVYASNIVQKPITLLSFLAVDEGISSPDDVAQLLDNML